MPMIVYVRLDRAAAMVRAINEAATEREHREAQLRCEGYMRRCEEIGQQWPGIELDMMFLDDERPMCCGEYLDWQPADACAA